MLHFSLSETDSFLSAPSSDEEVLSTSGGESAGACGVENCMPGSTPAAGGSEPAPLVEVRFRKACFEVSDVEEFRAGIACGQATLAGKQSEVTDEYLFALFDDLYRDMEISKPRLVGCVIGIVDALLHARKILPPEFAVHLRSLRKC